MTQVAWKFIWAPLLVIGIFGTFHHSKWLAMATHAGMTAEEFEKIVTDGIATMRHPTTKRPYTGTRSSSCTWLRRRSLGI
jgi:hypothetical protein